jgi:hypothetical protein
MILAASQYTNYLDFDLNCSRELLEVGLVKIAIDDGLYINYVLSCNSLH